MKSPKLQCPLPSVVTDVISMAHGGGGRAMHRLLEEFVLPAFRNEALEARHDGATLSVGDKRLAFTTDSYVVSPLFFPGGDIGSLAVNGTVNDLAMCGARPIALSAAFVMEEGLPLDTLKSVIASMQRTASEVSVPIVTGDTKVVERGSCDQLFITTSGVGVVEHGQTIAPGSIQAGDAIVLSGDVGRHGMAILACREGLQFASSILSDCAPLSSPVLGLLDQHVPVHCLRDLTRGGLATCLIEMAETSGLHIEVSEADIEVDAAVQGACAVMGLDPLYLANEGRFIAIVPPESAEHAVQVLRRFPMSSTARCIGHVSKVPASLVTFVNTIGTRRVLQMQDGEQLPRIC